MSKNRVYGLSPHAGDAPIWFVADPDGLVSTDHPIEWRYLQGAHRDLLWSEWRKIEAEQNDAIVFGQIACVARPGEACFPGVLPDDVYFIQVRYCLTETECTPPTN